MTDWVEEAKLQVMGPGGLLATSIGEISARRLLRMKTRTLGRTGLEVGVIGLGTEYLNGTPGRNYTSVVHRAVEAGVNYIDIVYSFPEYLDNLGAALKGKRRKVLITGHLGSAETDGQYRRSRDIAECESLFHDLLARVRTDHVDIAFLSNCDREDDYRRMTRPGGLLELALRFQQDGKVRFIGFSGHQPRVSLKAVQSGQIDVLMHSINIQGAATTGRKDLFLECAAQDVGLVGMKPFAGGSLLGHRGKKALTPVQCLNYALSQPGVSTVVPGLSSPEELRQALAYLQATDEEKDFSAVLPEFQEVEEGTCVYCNHCLPCPVGINIGETIRALVTAERGGLEAARAAYARLPVKASECIECEECVERCPFSVNILPLVQQARGIFEAMGP